MADVDPESDAATVGSTRTRRRAEVGLFTKVETKYLTCESVTKHRVEELSFGFDVSSRANTVFA